jgi:competence protein ComEC
MARFPSLAIGLGLALLGPALAAELSTHVLDVGQGDATLLLDGDDHVVLIDAGPPAAGPTIERHLTEHGISRLDAVVISHAHLDHYGGLSHLIGRVRIGEILYGTRVHTTMYAALEEKIRAAGIPYRHVSPGDRLPLSSPIDARVIFAGQEELPLGTPIQGDRGLLGDGPCHIEDGTDEDTGGVDLNAFSVVVRAALLSRSLVFTGDAPGTLEDALIGAGAQVGADLLKVSHHGSRFSSTPGFLGAVRPRHATISCAAGNDYGHPHAEAMQRLKKTGCTVHRTDRDGTIAAWTDGNGFVVNSSALLLGRRAVARLRVFDLLVAP